MTAWRIKRGEQEFIAPDVATLKEWAKQGRLAADDYLFNPILEKWIYARDAAELQGLTSQAPVRAATELQGLTSQAKRSRTAFSRGSLGLLILFVGLIALVLSHVKGPEMGSTGERPETPVRYRLSATQLYDAYEANAVAADAKYKGEIVVVSGTIQSIGKDILDSAYVVIGGKGFLDGVQCFFAKSEVGVLGSTVCFLYYWYS